MTDDIKQDFEAAMVKHLLFKSRLRSFLYGRATDEAALRDPQQCTFGHWIQQRALGAYQHLPESRTLDQVHKQIHQLANKLMDLHQRGRTEEALAGLPQMQVLADRITALLRTMEEKLRTTL